MPTPSASRKPRTWLDALIATTLRWNDRLGREVVSAGPEVQPSAGTAPRGGPEGGAAPKAPLPSASRGR